MEKKEIEKKFYWKKKIQSLGELKCQLLLRKRTSGCLGEAGDNGQL